MEQYLNILNYPIEERIVTYLSVANRPITQKCVVYIKDKWFQDHAEQINEAISAGDAPIEIDAEDVELYWNDFVKDLFKKKKAKRGN